MSDELKACECGGEESGDEAHHYVACWQCGRRGPRCETEAKAIAAWNRRTVTREQVETMRRCEHWSEYDMARISRKDMVLALLRAAGFEVVE